MISKKQVLEIREHLKKAQNPLFYFDNDADGLCSYLLLQRFLGRGKGVPVKGAPKLSGNFFSKVNELNPDYIFILDTPVVSEEFFEKAKQREIPVVWVDHHEPSQEIPKEIFYFNSLVKEKEEREPVTYICYKITERKEDLWIAIAGCISDNFIPDFYNEFKKKYPELSLNSDKAFDILYGSGLGTITRILNYFLKDRTTNVINMVKFLTKTRSPYDVLDEDKKNKLMHERFNKIENKINYILEKFNNSLDSSKKILYLEYGGDLSVSSELANKIKFQYPDKIIIVAYISKDKVNISGRGRNIRKLMHGFVKGFEDATTGGHEKAVGAKINLKDLEEFRRRIKSFEKEGY